MDVFFKDGGFRDDCLNDKARNAAFGAIRAKCLRRRLSSIAAATTLEELRNAPGRFHELKGDLKGMLSSDLDGPYRLILEPIVPEGEAKEHANGLKWSKIKAVRILGIKDTHE